MRRVLCESVPLLIAHFSLLFVSLFIYSWLCLLQVDKSPEGQFIQLMALPRILQQKITKLVDPPGKNRDVEEILLQVAQDPDCGAVVQQGLDQKKNTWGGW